MVKFDLNVNISESFQNTSQRIIIPEMLIQ